MERVSYYYVGNRLVSLKPNLQIVQMSAEAVHNVADEPVQEEQIVHNNNAPESESALAVDGVQQPEEQPGLVGEEATVSCTSGKAEEDVSSSEKEAAAESHGDTDAVEEQSQEAALVEQKENTEPQDQEVSHEEVSQQKEQQEQQDQQEQQEQQEQTEQSSEGSENENSTTSADSKSNENTLNEEDHAVDKQTNESETGSNPIDENLVEKQCKLINESGILQSPTFKNVSEEEKVSAIIALLNTDPQTAMPNALPLAPEKPSEAQSDSKNKKRRFPRPDMSQPMSAEERARYAEYLNGETKITEIQSFPPKSRLFIGNLPLKNVKKEDLFRIFSRYGHIFQINIKNAFGFIQYDNPTSVLDAIECESEELNFGKKLILEVSSSNARPQFDHGDHGSNTSSTYATSSKRIYDNDDNEDDDMYSDNHYKKSKKRTPQCLIYVKKAADRTYAYSVFTNISKKTGLETDMVILKPRMELRKLVNDAAYDGVWGVVLVNKNKNVDVQTFYLGPSGETKSDEYVSVSMDEAVSIFNNIKATRMGPPSISPVMSAQPYGMPPHQSVMPQQPYNYMPPQQHYPGNMPMMPQQQMYGNMPPASNYGIPPQMQQHSYQGYPQQSQMMPPQQGGLDQNQLLAALQNLPPNIVSNLLQLAQQPNQQQQQQALGVIQQIQAGIPLQQQQQQQLQQPQLQQHPQQQQPPQQQQQPPQNHQQQQQPQQQQQQQSYGNYMMPQGINSQEKRASDQAGSQQQAQTQAQNNNNVQSLLDSLAKLQK